MKQTKHFIFFLILSILFIKSAKSQTYSDTSLWVIIKNPEMIPLSEDTPATGSESFNLFLYSNKVHYLRKVFPGAINDTLARVYELRFDSCNVDALISNMVTNFGNDFSNHSKDVLNKGIMCYNPIDDFWTLTSYQPDQWLWHLKIIKADEAWNITKGNSSIVIGLLDTKFDIIMFPKIKTEI